MSQSYQRLNSTFTTVYTALYLCKIEGAITVPPTNSPCRMFYGEKYRITCIEETGKYRIPYIEEFLLWSVTPSQHFYLSHHHHCIASSYNIIPYHTDIDGCTCNNTYPCNNTYQRNSTQLHSDRS